MKRTPLKRKPSKKTKRTAQQKRAMEKRKCIRECDAIVRALALARDGGCVVCGSKDNLQVSHIYPKGKYPLMRFDLDNVEIRCAGHHKFLRGSPHGDPAGFAEWLATLPEERLARLRWEAQFIGRADILWLRQTHEGLLEGYKATFGVEWGE